MSKTFQQLVETCDVDGLLDFMKEYGLILDGDTVIPSNDASRSKLNYLAELYDRRQLSEKIRLNSLYGALLNESLRFYDPRVGQSVTLTGRSITRHMISKTNEVITGKYEHTGGGIIYGDTDSVAGDTLICTNAGMMTIEKLFTQCALTWSVGEKEYACDDRFRVLGIADDGSLALKAIAYVYRHRVSKGRCLIGVQTGQSVEVTDDHSIMVERDGHLVEVHARDIERNDVLIVAGESGVIRTGVSFVEELSPFDDEYVYDIGVQGQERFFFANDILVHNSCYFSAYEVLRDNPDFAEFEWSRENVVLLYDQIADEVNASFPDFMQKAFNTSYKRGTLIQAGRELVGSKALFIKKKKYAILIYDMEGDRVDVNGKPGKLKPMGLDLKRADTPKFMQEFLERLLIDLLVGKPQEELFEDVKRFREEFKRRPGWEKGTPKAVKAFSDFVKREAEMEKKSREMGALTKGKKAKIDMPGHVRASINWNTLCDEHNDRFSMRISDGSKVIVCKLKANLWGFDSIAYPIDEANLPDWFKGLPFDDELMEETIIDNKLMNLVGVLDWDLTKTKDSETDDFFDFGG